MNKAILALATLARLSLSVNANDRCVDMEAICTTDIHTFKGAVGKSIIETSNYYGCLSRQPNPTWWYLEIDDPGDITMSLSVDSDIDYSVSFERSIIRFCYFESEWRQCFKLFWILHSQLTTVILKHTKQQLKQDMSWFLTIEIISSAFLFLCCSGVGSIRKPRPSGWILQWWIKQRKSSRLQLQKYQSRNNPDQWRQDWRILCHAQN